jgi:Spy/CpxP family protein refolding chaperone
MTKWFFLAAFLPGLLCAQFPMGEVCRQQQKPVPDLNLSESQQKQISAICKDSFKKVSDLRESWRKAEAELQEAFDESPVDQAKSNIAIDHLSAARSDLFRATSQMDLQIRTVLTNEQWKELKKRMRRGPGRPGPDGGWRRGGPSTKSTAPTGQPQNR